MDVQKAVRQRLLKAKKDPVYFGEHFLKNTQMKPYSLEPQQKLFLKDKSPYKILFCSRRSGKTLTMIIDILHNAFFRRNQQIVLLAPTQDQAKTFANVMNDMILRSPMLGSSFIVDNKLEKQLSNGSRINFKTTGAQSGQKQNSAVVGNSVNILYIDECQAMDAESMSTIMPVVTGQLGQAEIVLAGTPRNRAGFFYTNIMNAKTIRECYVNNGKPKPCPNNGRYSLHRFQITDLDEDGNVAYSRAEYRLSIDELETIKDTIGKEMFLREYALEFLDSISMPYYADLRKMAGILQEPKFFQSRDVAVGGIDFGKKRNNSVLTIATQTPTHDWEAKYFKVWPLGTKYQEITHFLLNLLPVYFPNFQTLALDRTGVGESIAEGLENQTKYNTLDVIFSQPKKVDLVENSINLMESRMLTYYEHPKLGEEMDDYTRETTENDRVVYQKGTSDDFIDSFNLCALSISDYIHNGGVRTMPLRSYSLGTNVFGNKDYRKKSRDRWSSYLNKRR